MPKKLKLYTDKNWMITGLQPVILLFPFWGAPKENENDPDRGRFDEYMQKAHEIFEFTQNINDCDAALLPYDHNPDEKITAHSQKIAAEAKAAGKKLILFFNADQFEDIPIDNAIIFRTSFFKSARQKDTFSFPGWSIDFLRGMKEEQWLLKKAKRARVSYTGYVDTLVEPKLTLRRIAGKILKPMKKENYSYGRIYRGKAIRHLLKCKDIDTDFIIREGFWGGTEPDKQKIRNEFKNSLLNSPYAFVTRGAGNYSYRLYEVMSCGRIPLFMNTDAVLPFENLIDWKKHVIWVEDKNLNSLGKALADFHSRTSEKELMAMQKANREIYQTYLSPYGFYRHLHTCL